MQKKNLKKHAFATNLFSKTLNKIKYYKKLQRAKLLLYIYVSQTRVKVNNLKSL